MTDVQSETEIEQMVDEVLGKTFTEDEVPAYPAQINWRDGDFFTGKAYCSIKYVEVRFREANHTEDGDFTVREARWRDTSNPEDSYGEWKHECQ